EPTGSHTNFCSKLLLLYSSAQSCQSQFPKLIHNNPKPPLLVDIAPPDADVASIAFGLDFYPLTGRLYYKRNLFGRLSRAVTAVSVISTLICSGDKARLCNTYKHSIKVRKIERAEYFFLKQPE